MLQIDQVGMATARTSQQFSLISAGLACLVWGSWAYWVNLGSGNDAGWGSPVSAGLTQGTGSFVITLIMVRVVTWLYHQMPDNSMKVVWPALITLLVTGTILATAHLMVGTQNIFQTILPALSMALVFNLYTATKLRQLERKATVT